MAGRPPKAEAEKKIQRTIQFEKDILEWLESRAVENDRTPSVEINRILKKVKEQEARHDTANH